MVPYLMNVPDEFLGFFKLFEKLGAAKKISSLMFAKVLEQIHSCGDDVLTANELKIAGKAMKLFFEFLPSNVSDSLDHQVLYLLSDESRLLEAGRLIYINDPRLGRVIKDTEERFEVLSNVEGMDEENTLKKIVSLPERIRPRLISDVIKSEIDISKAIITENQLSREINDFLKSNDLVNGVVRLIYKERQEKKEDLPSAKDISNIKQNLQGICMKCARGMQVVFTFQHRQIYSRPYHKYFECKDENGHKICSIYADFSHESHPEKVVKNNLDHITRAIRTSAGCNFHNSSDYLSMMCLKVENSGEIESLLNENNIPSLTEKHKDVFHRLPKPGDIVDIRWHVILDNAFISFEVEEYVAYLAGSNERGDIEYRYAIVKEKLSTAASTDLSFLQAYLVQTTIHEKKEMKAYELYKFNRSKKSDEQQTFEDFQVQVLYRREANSESSLPPKDNRTLEEIFKEVRDSLKHAFTLPEEKMRNMCRRVMFQWHPDKNPDDVERATKVFQYIRKIIQKLENGENVDAEERTEQPNRSHAWSDSFFQEFERFFQREQEYQRRYHRSTSSSNRHYQHSEDTSRRRQHSEDTYYPNPQPFEATRWLNESKYDIRFAWQSKSSEENFHSWICFISHQVSGFFFSNICKLILSFRATLIGTRVLTPG
jgi:hypothetical protein